jgi:CSLREA domain-containing protein
LISYTFIRFVYMNFRKIFVSAIIVFGFLVLSPVLAHAATFTVDSTGDGADNALDGLCATSGGVCTLRAAIAEANNTAGPHSINFNIPTSDSGYRDFDTESTPSSGDSIGGDDFWTINPASVLPTITATGVTIDGATQTTNRGNVNTSGPEIQIDGTTAGEVDGLTFSGTNGTVNSITINRFGSVANAIKVNADGFTLTNSYVGPFAKGNTGATTTNRSGYGIYFNVASGTIGTSTSNGNVISGNGTTGIYATCGTGSGKRVNIAGNKLGLGADGTTVLNNDTSDIEFVNYCLSIVGGDTASQRNYIAGTNYGIALTLGSSSVPLIEMYNNFFGTNTSGVSNTSINAYAIYPKGGIVYDADFVTIKIGASGKGNLFGYAYQTIALWDTAREVEIAYNTFGSSYAETVLFVNYTANLNLTKIHHNFFGVSTSDPYFGVATVGNSISGSTCPIYISATSNVEVYNNTLNGNSGGMFLEAESGLNIHDNTITNMSLSTTIQSVRTSFTTNLTFNNNEIAYRTSGNAAGVIDDDSTGMTITNNKIHDITGSGIQQIGNESNFNISNNEIYNTLNNMRVGGSGQTGIKIRSNKLYNASTFANITLVGKTTNGFISSANDAGDADAGNNELMNYPEIQTVTYIGGGKYRVAGRFDGKVAEAPFTIEVCESNNNTGGGGYGGCIQSLGTTTTGSSADSTSGSSNYFNYTADVQSQYTSEHQGILFSSLSTNNLNSTGTFSQVFDASTSNVNYTSHIDAVPVANGDGTYTITVDSTGDQDNVSTQGENTGAGAYSGGGVNGASGLADGKTTLREAIIVANNFNPAGLVKIAFNIPTSDSGYRDYDTESTPSSGNSAENDDFWYIAPATVLPTITGSDITIDGTTQTTNKGDKNTSGPEIEIDGTTAGEVRGLYFTGVNGNVKGITINRFGSALAAIEAAADGFAITNSYVGPDAKGLLGYSSTNRSAYGIYMNVASGTIGTTTSDGNIISGNATYGIYASCGTGGGKAINIAGNKIGLGSDGTTVIANGSGAYILNDCLAVIGGNSSTNRNYIAGGSIGLILELSASATPKTEVYNNFFGTDTSGILNKGFSSRAIFSQGSAYAHTSNQVIIGGLGKGNLIRFVAANSAIDFNTSVKKFYVGYNTIADITGNAIRTGAAPTASGLTIEYNNLGAFTTDSYFGLNTGTVTGQMATIQGGVDGAQILHNNMNCNNSPNQGIGAGNSGINGLTNSIVSYNVINKCMFGIGVQGNNTVISNNTITESARTGISLRDSVGGIKLLNNIVYNNNQAGLGYMDIELGHIIGGYVITPPGINPNDAGDVDTGSNDLMNWPEIQTVTYLGAGKYRVAGRLDAKVSEAPFTIEVCESNGAALGNGGCTQSLGTTTTASSADSTSGSSNYFNWIKDVQTQYSTKHAGIIFTGLATNNNNSTSEFGTNYTCTDDTACPSASFPIALVAPAADASIDDVTPLFDWNPSQLSDATANPELDHYSLLIDGVELATTNASTTQYQVTDPQRLAYGAHTWQVLAKKSDNSTNGTSIEQSFTITAPTYTFTPVYPVDVEIDTQTPLFDWTSIADGSDATFYELYLDGHFLTDTVPLSQSEYQLPDNLALAEGTHTWQVVAYYTDVNSQPVEVGRTASKTFTIKLPVSDYPIELVNPKKGAETQDATPFFDWNTSEKDGVVNPNLSYYKVFVNGSEVGKVNASDTEFTLPESKRLAYGKSYTWQVIAYSSVDVPTGTSEERTFKVITPKYDFDPRYPVDVTIDTGHPIFRWTNISKEKSVTDFDLFIDEKYVSTVKRNDDAVIEYDLPVEKALSDGDHTWQVVAYYKDVNGKTVEVGRTKTSKFTVNTKIISQLPDTGTKEPTKTEIPSVNKGLIAQILSNPVVLATVIAVIFAVGGGILILGNYLGWWFIPFLLVKRRKKKEKEPVQK